MRTSELIDYILDFTGNTIPREKLLRWINIAQNELLSMNTKISRVQDEYLTTVDGQLEYLLPAGTRFVARVYAKKTLLNNYRYKSRGALQSGHLDDGTEV